MREEIVLMNTKRVCKIGVLLLAVVLIVTSSYVGEVYAAGTSGGGGITEEERQELNQLAYERSYFLISENDIAVFSNEVSHYKLTHPSNTVCPNNTAYYIDRLYYNGEKVIDDEFDNAVAKADTLPFDKSLNALGIEGLQTLNISWANYTSRDLTVVDANTTIFVPGKVTVNAGYTNETDYAIAGRKSDGSWDTLITTYEPRRRWNMGGIAQDTTIKCSDFMKDDYVYYSIVTTQGTDAIYSATEVERFIVPNGNLGAFNKLCNNEYTFTQETTPTPEPTPTPTPDPTPTPEPTPDSGNVVSVDEKTGTAIVYDNVSGRNVKVSSSIIKEGAVYRMYDPSRGEHFYTKDVSERDALILAGWQHESNADFIVVSATEEDASPVYRLYNPNDGGMHFYTDNAIEAIQLKANGWRYEGISHYVYSKNSSKGISQIRLYNPNSSNGEHNWTTDLTEYNMLRRLGWKDEGVCWNIK